MKDRTACIEHHQRRFAGRSAARAAEPAFLRAAREQAMARFAAVGFPTTRDEDWRYTSVEAIAGRPFRGMESTGNGLSPERLDGLALGLTGAARLVFVNGRFDAARSTLGRLPSGVQAGSLAASLGSPAVEANLARAGDAANPFAALNGALWRDGAFVHVPAGVDLPEPIHVVYLTTAAEADAVADLRSLVVVGDGSRLRLVETWVGGEGIYWTNPVTEIVAGAGAAVDHVKVQREGPAGLHVATLEARLGRDASFSSCSISLGGALVRNDLNVHLDAEGAGCSLDGLYLLTGGQHEDNHTRVDHVRPHTSSRELYKGVLDGHSRGVFNGAVVVRPDAQKTDARQANRNLLLSDEARIDTKPQLEIFADDVKCSHGATVGQIEETELFYLRSRGLDPEEARGLLIHAFAAEILNRLPVPELRPGLEAALAERLPSFRAEEHS